MAEEIKGIFWGRIEVGRVQQMPSFIHCFTAGKLHIIEGKMNGAMHHGILNDELLLSVNDLKL